MSDEMTAMQMLSAVISSAGSFPDSLAGDNRPLDAVKHRIGRRATSTLPARGGVSPIGWHRALTREGTLNARLSRRLTLPRVL